MTVSGARLSAIELVGEAGNDTAYELHDLAGRQTEQDIRNHLPRVLDVTTSSANNRRGDPIARCRQLVVT